MFEGPGSLKGGGLAVDLAASHHPDLGGARAHGSLGDRPLSAGSAELLGQCDDDARGAADVTEPIGFLVLPKLANEFGALGALARKDVLNVIDGEHDATYA